MIINPTSGWVKWGWCSFKPLWNIQSKSAPSQAIMREPPLDVRTVVLAILYRTGKPDLYQLGSYFIWMTLELFGMQKGFFFFFLRNVVSVEFNSQCGSGCCWMKWVSTLNYNESNKIVLGDRELLWAKRLLNHEIRKQTFTILDRHCSGEVPSRVRRTQASQGPTFDAAQAVQCV